MNESNHGDESVQHLLALGYADPDEAAARDAALRQQRTLQLQKATELHRAGRVGEAVDLLQSLAAEDPAWIAPHQQLAAIHYGGGRIADAEAELDWLTHCGVEHPRLALLAAGVALVRRSLPEALRQLDYVTCVAPELPGASLMLGVVLSRLARFGDAERAFQAAVDQNPRDAKALDGLAALALREKRFEEAATFALTALEHDLRLFEAHYHLGISLSGMGRPGEAVSALETAARLQPLRAAPFRRLAQIANEQLRDPALLHILPADAK